MTATRTRLVIGLVVGLSLLAPAPGCAHRRESYYPPAPGVRVRAPFVDVRVPTAPRGARVHARRFAGEPGLDLETRAADDDRDDD